jgi:hypothetical protein
MKLVKSILKQVLAWSLFIGFFWVLFWLMEIKLIGDIFIGHILGFLFFSYLLGVIALAALGILGIVGTWVTKVTEDLNFFKEQTKSMRNISYRILTFLIGAVLFVIGYYFNLINF